MNWHVTISISGHTPTSHLPSKQPDAGPRFAGSAISMGDPSAAVHILFVAPHVAGGIGATQHESEEAAQLSMYTLLAVSTLSLWALSMALFRVEEQRNEQHADEQRAEAHKEAAQRRPTQHAGVGPQQAPVHAQQAEAVAPAAPTAPSPTAPAAAAPAHKTYVMLPLDERIGVETETRAAAKALPVGAGNAERSAERQARKRELIAAARHVDQRMHELADALKGTVPGDMASASVAGPERAGATGVKSA